MRLLLPLLLVLFVLYMVRQIVRGITAGIDSGSERERSGTQESKRRVKTGKMEKDPICGVFVDIATAIQSTFDGEPKYFCSTDCLKKFKETHSRS